MSPNPAQLEENFKAVAKNKFDLDGLRAALKADNPDEIRTVAWKYFTALLVLEDAKKVAKDYGVAKGTVYTELNREIKPDLLRILQRPEKTRIIWSQVSDWLLEAGYGKNQEPISIDWQQVCREVLKNQNQWLTTHALGSGHRRVSDMYVPLELVERKQPLRLDPNIPPEKGSEYYQEKRTPIKHEDFFEQVFKQGVSLESNGRRIAIIGEPGTGKTTLLQEIASRVEGLPIWVDLAELNPQVEDCLENYLLQKWLKKKASPVIRRLLPEVVPSQEELEKAFKDAFSHNPVWLLLDGVNEIPANLSNSLTWIDKQIREGWIAEARVVLTCRLNVGDIHNDLPGFDIYCNRDFSYPKQVEEFIDKWFIKKAEQESRDNLKAELKRANERIQNLIRNPLRLMLLCRTWEDGVKLQDITKAGLYQRLVKGLYKLKDRDNNPKFKIGRNRQEELNCKLGKLALQAIDSKDARFRLRESSIEEFLGYPDQENSLFWIARELGWLNRVGLPRVEEKDSDENVYAFFHPTFQEYFAACAINEDVGYWNFFLPCDHIDRPVKEKDNSQEYKRYRIFDSQWKEVILLWLGRPDENLTQQKEEFIKALVEFEDGCNTFYKYQAYFLAAVGITEFNALHWISEIVPYLVNLSFGIFNPEQKRWIIPLEPIREAAKSALLETERTTAIEAIVDLIQACDQEDVYFPICLILEKIGAGYLNIINFLEKKVPNIHNSSIREKAAKTLGMLEKANKIAITTLIDLVKTNKNACFLQNVGKSLEEIGVGNCIVVQALETLLKSNSNNKYKEFYRIIAHCLARVQKGNNLASEVLVCLSRDSQNKNRWRALESIGEVCENQWIAISALEDIAQHDEDEFIRILAATNLWRIAPKNTVVIKAIENTVEKSEQRYIHYESTKILSQIAQEDPKGVTALEKLTQSKSEYLRHIAAYSLGKIEKSKSKAVETLEYLSLNSEDKEISCKAAYYLAQIDKSNFIAIKTLEKYATEQSKDKNFQNRAACHLIQMAPNNHVAIKTLEQFASYSESENVRRIAAINLGYFHPENSIAINTITELSKNTENALIRGWASKDLGVISRFNSTLYNTLTELIKNSQDGIVCREAVDSLKSTLNLHQRKKVIAALKDYLSEQIYRNDFERFYYCYEVIWDCAQNMPYPEFYQVWHSEDSIC